jgi:hypothetical protein
MKANAENRLLRLVGGAQNGVSAAGGVAEAAIKGAGQDQAEGPTLDDDELSR